MTARPMTKVDPLKHRSGMYLRWDPEGPGAAAAEAAWAGLMQDFARLPLMDPETGAAEQQIRMIEFDGGANPWEDGPKRAGGSGGSSHPPESLLTAPAYTRWPIQSTRRVLGAFPPA
jgi:hypothetical protein